MSDHHLVWVESPACRVYSGLLPFLSVWLPSFWKHGQRQVTWDYSSHVQCMKCTCVHASEQHSASYGHLVGSYTQEGDTSQSDFWGRDTIHRVWSAVRTQESGLWTFVFPTREKCWYVIHQEQRSIRDWLWCCVNCDAVMLCCCDVMLGVVVMLWCCDAVMWCCVNCDAVLLWYDAVVLDAVVLWCWDMVLWCDAVICGAVICDAVMRCCAAVMWCCAAVMWCCDVVMLWRCDAVRWCCDLMLWCDVLWCDDMMWCGVSTVMCCCREASLLLTSKAVGSKECAEECHNTPNLNYRWRLPTDQGMSRPANEMIYASS